MNFSERHAAISRLFIALAFVSVTVGVWLLTSARARGYLLTNGFFVWLFFVAAYLALWLHAFRTARAGGYGAHPVALFAARTISEGLFLVLLAALLFMNPSPDALLLLGALTAAAFGCRAAIAWWGLLSRGRAQGPPAPGRPR